MMISKGNSLSASLIAAIASAMAGGVIWLCVDQLLPFIFILSPFFLLLSIPVGLPILVCWRYLGAKSALWAAGFSTLFLFVVLPSSFAFLILLQLIAPVSFVATIADLRTPPSLSNRENFIPLSAILSSTTLLVTISNLVLAAFVNNSSHITALLDSSLGEMMRILTLMRTISPSQISQFEMLLRLENHALVVKMFALYSFVAVFLNFYIASRINTSLSKHQRPRDFWPYNATSLPRIQIVLLVGAVLLSRLSINATLQDCLDVLIMMLTMSFSLTGLAAIHLISRTKTWRPLLLCVIYGLFLPLFASFILAFWGMFVSSTSFLQRYKNNLQPPF